MKDTSPNIIRYAGKKWSLIIEIMIDDMDLNNPQQVFALDNSNLKKFKYSNAFNNLCLVGEIEYHDAYGQLDKLLDRQFAYCAVRMIQHKQQSDGSVTLEKFDLGQKFVHTFLINSVKITKRVGSSVDYVLSLISANWFNCSQNINFTNYDKAPQQIFDILKSCISEAKFQIDLESFDRVRTNVKINYITNGNDNLFSISKFLLNKLYYFNSKDDSIKTLIFNETSNMFQLYDFKQQNIANGTSQVIVSMFKNQSEGMIEEEPNEFATIVDFKADQYIQNVFNYNVTDYTYQYNNFVDRSFTNSAVANYLNNKSPTNTYKIRNKLPFDEFNGLQRHTYWNNSIDVYQQTIEQQLKMNSLVLNTSPDIIRKPGSLVTISLDRSMFQVTSDTRADLEDSKKRFLGFEGLWIVSKVVHIIEPPLQRYRQNLTLSRNYMLEDQNIKST